MNTLISTHAPLSVQVIIEDWFCEPICEYTVDWNNPKHRLVFAEQANNAIRAGQFVTTVLKDHPAGHCATCKAPKPNCVC